MDRALRCWILQCGLISLLLVTSSCASRYHEPSRSDGRTAYLEAVVPVWLVSIDDKQVSSFSPFGQKQLRVTAGPHVVEVQFYDKINGSLRRVYHASTNNFRVGFTALPGRSYRVNAGFMGNRWRPYVTDTLEPVFSDLKLN